MFKIMVLQALYPVSGDATEFQVEDRLSFQHLPGFRLGGMERYATTLWQFRAQLANIKAIGRWLAPPMPASPPTASAKG